MRAASGAFVLGMCLFCGVRCLRCLHLLLLVLCFDHGVSHVLHGFPAAFVLLFVFVVLMSCFVCVMLVCYMIACGAFF